MPRDPALIRLLPLLWRDWQHHPWRHALVMLAVALGVALAFSVQVINHSALAEFGAAVRAVNGEPDLSLRGRAAGLSEDWLDRLALLPGVRHASPVSEVETYAAAADGRRLPCRPLCFCYQTFSRFLRQRLSFRGSFGQARPEIVDLRLQPVNIATDTIEACLIGLGVVAQLVAFEFLFA